MEGRDVAAILLGGTPLIAHDRSTLEWDDDGFYALTLQRGEVRQRIEIGPDRRRLDVLRSEVRDGRGVVWELEHEDHERIGGIPFPKKIHFVNAREDADVLVQYQDVQLNPDLPDDAGVLDNPYTYTEYKSSSTREARESMFGDSTAG